jgi:hypothetical protein
MVIFLLLYVLPFSMCNFIFGMYIYGCLRAIYGTYLIHLVRFNILALLSVYSLSYLLLVFFEINFRRCLLCIVVLCVILS